jgi:hypothetical protein
MNTIVKKNLEIKLFHLEALLVPIFKQYEDWKHDSTLMEIGKNGRIIRHDSGIGLESDELGESFDWFEKTGKFEWAENMSLKRKVALLSFIYFKLC